MKENNLNTSHKDMKKVIQDLINSLNNDKIGYSGKKLTIITIVGCIVVGHLKLYNSDNWNQLFVSVLTVDIGFVLTLFGLNITDKKINTNNE